MNHPLRSLVYTILSFFQFLSNRISSFKSLLWRQHNYSPCGLPRPKSNMTEPIPGPSGLPLVGNLFDVTTEETSIGSIERLADIYGPIFQLHLAGKRLIVVSSAAFLAEVADEKRFMKHPPAAAGGGEGKGAKGLFGAKTDDPDWGQAHRVLVPAFGPLSIEAMFPEMKDIANQLLLKWARQGLESRISATEDFTRLTLDTIALCAMDYRFNNFYTDSMHPFVDAMTRTLAGNAARGRTPKFLLSLMWKQNAQKEEDQKLMGKTCMGIINHRRANPSEKKDLLNATLNGVDPKTGEHLRDELIMANMITFLIAGHETTSGLLSFAFLGMLKNSNAYLKAQAEVDEVLGRGPIEVHHLKKLKYINAVLRETLRLWPTAPGLQKRIAPPKQNEFMTLGGKYKVENDDNIMVLLTKTHRDPSIYGDDAKEFKPERMLDEEFDKLPPGAWKPFGNGTRACIGRPFAWQEALMVTAMVLQNFDLQLDDPAYELRIKQAATIKPRDFFIKARLRKGITPTDLDHALHANAALGDKIVDNGAAKAPVRSEQNDVKQDSGKKMTILYGSNTGTCQAFAQRLAADASSRGFTPEVQDLDSGTGQLPKGTPVIIATPSYEGQPADNAARFVQWLEGCKGQELEGVEYAVFGCGHSDWAGTFHRIPRLVDGLMEEHGAKRIAPIGLTNVAKGNLFGDFEDWLDETLWPALHSKQGSDHAENAVHAEISTQARASSLRYDVNIGKVLKVQKLTGEGEAPKYHVEVQLPSKSTYECGDYLAVLPLNPDKTVRRVMSHFQLPWDAVITLKTSGPSTIPTNTPLSVYDVLRSYVELSQPATKKSLRLCAQCSTSEADQTHLDSLCTSTSNFDTEILSKRTSLFDILSHRRSIQLPFGDFLAALPPMGVRQYSISSSPLSTPDTCTLTFSVVDSPSLTDPQTAFEGVASTYLSSLSAGDSIQVSIRPTAKKTFRLPLDDERTPLLMFCAGSGLAPFRGFVQQRAIQLSANPERKLAKALLFVGCRSGSSDRLYPSEMDEWAKLGAVDVRYAFSKDSQHSEGCAHVADRMLRDMDDIVEVWRAGARVYVCGSRAFEQSLHEPAAKIFTETRGKATGITDPEEVQRWFTETMQERMVSDIFD